jgi:hypothetical protein
MFITGSSPVGSNQRRAENKAIPIIVPDMILHDPIRVAIRITAPMMQHRADVSPIEPWTLPMKKFHQDEPIPLETIVEIEPLVAAAASPRTVAPV